MVDRHTGESVHKDLGCFVLVVTSHGDEGSIVGSDHKHIKITDMIGLLSAKNFPELKGKPKIIILQACAGGEYKILNILISVGERRPLNWE
mgnify:FL=1